MPPGVAAQIGERTLTVSTLTNALARRLNAPTPDEPRALFEELIRSEALIEKARAAGYDRRPELVEQFERLVAERFREDQLGPRLEQAAQVGEAEIQARYAERATHFTLPESVRAGVLFLRASSKAEPEPRRHAQTEAETLLETARQTNAAGFAWLVQTRSDDQATRYAGGDTGWLTRGIVGTRWPEEVTAAAFAVSQPGQFAPLVDTPQGFYIVRLTERRPARLRPLAEVRDTIRYQLAQEKRRQAEEAFYEDLKSGLKIKINHALLEELLTPAHSNSQRPPPLPGG
jgi:peptidyl-prolyl cis-trans isomerase C